MPTVDEAFADAVNRHQAGDLEAAERMYRELLAVTPAHPGCLSNLGVLVARRGDLEEAAHLYHRALMVNPNQLDAHFNLGNVYRKQGKLQEAIESYQNALTIQPSNPRVMLNLGIALSDLGDMAAATDLYRRAIHRDPGFAEAYNLLGDALFRMNLIEESIGVFRQFIGQVPDDPRGHHNLGLALAAHGQGEEALPELEQALKLRPDYAEAHNSYAVALDAVGRVDEAVAHYRKATSIRPNLADAWSNLGISLTEQGRTKEAIDAIDKSLHVRLDPRVASNRLVAMAYSSDFTAEQLRAAHEEWASLYADVIPMEPPTAIDKDPDRRLRIGYVSGDFRNHPIGAFFEAVLSHHDRNRVHITCYSTQARSDARTDRIRKKADLWRRAHAVTDPALARMIREDGIDVLVDLSGHTAGNRLTVFARRPAIAQTHLYGYPTTTGVPAIDFRVTDSFVDPPGETEGFYTEALARLPENAWLYPTPASAPEVATLPAKTKKHFTFGCLNSLAKLSDACLEVWAKVLKAVPKSRLVLMAGRSAEAAGIIVKRFGKLGIATDRIEPVSRMPDNQYFEGYQPLDLALDPFPQNGGVTTCDSLWMGVPVLTVAGRDYRSPQGVSLLNNVGLPEFVADSSEKLIELAATWADQREGLAELRESLREMMTQSPLTDAGRYVRNLEAEYRRMWQAKLAAT